jgi:GNAT superfamily N-acetyltransferase
MKQEVMALWRCCFGDSEEFTRFYFDAKYQDENTMVWRDAKGAAVAALQMLPYRMTFAGEEINVSYVSGACTHPSRRREGIMSRLLAAALRRERERGVSLSVLIPQEDSLYAYYRRQGYSPVFTYHPVEERDGGEVPGLEVREAEAGDELTTTLLAYFEARIRERAYCVQHDRDDLAAVAEDLLSGSGSLLGAFTSDGEIVGVAFAEPSCGNVQVKDHVCDSPEVRHAIVGSLAKRWPGFTQVWRELPAEEPVTPHGMARVLNMELLLHFHAVAYPEESLGIQVTDELFPDNTDLFSRDRGTCHRGKRNGVLVKMDAGGMTSWLLRRRPGSHPFMSLMLD